MMSGTQIRHARNVIIKGENMKFSLFTCKTAWIEIFTVMVVLAVVVVFTGCGSEVNPDFIAFEDQRHPFKDSEHYTYLKQSNYPLQECYVCHNRSDVPEEPKSGGSCKSTECHPGEGGPGACNTCHWADAADLAIARDSGDTDIEMHYRHASAYSGRYQPVGCQACHAVPESWNSEGHIHDETPGQAEVSFGFPANSRGAEPEYEDDQQSCSDVYCHGDLELDWQPLSSPIACGTCHELPPGSPHVSWPRITDCNECHGLTIDENGNIINPNTHANGVVFR